MDTANDSTGGGNCRRRGAKLVSPGVGPVDDLVTDFEQALEAPCSEPC